MKKNKNAIRNTLPLNKKHNSYQNRPIPPAESQPKIHGTQSLYKQSPPQYANQTQPYHHYYHVFCNIGNCIVSGHIGQWASLGRDDQVQKIRIFSAGQHDDEREIRFGRAHNALNQYYDHLLDL